MNELAQTKKTTPAKPRPWREMLEDASPGFAQALPAHVSIERFKRILASAITSNRDLQRAINENPHSVWNAALACAKDGLIPDGREAALVVFGTMTKCADGVKRKLATAQYMPMIGGILKMMRQSGEVASLTANVVREYDQFDYELGDEERIKHVPELTGDRGKMIAVYAILKTKDGGIYREVMGREEVMSVKNISRAKDEGPWSGPFESEMWRKTVLRRLAKRAPLSTDVLDLIQRDDGMYDLDQSAPTPLPAPPRPRVLDLATGQMSGGEDMIIEPEEESDPLEGDTLPPEVEGKPTDDAPEPPPEQKTVTKKAAEDEPEPEESAEAAQSDEPYATKTAVFKAMNAATSVAAIEEILDAARSCSWINEKGRQGSIEAKAEQCIKAIQASAEETN